MSHRPLSIWVGAAPVAVTASGPQRVNEVNDGARKADARSMSKYTSGWRRRAVPLPGGGHALGLVREATGEAVVEVDERARPIRVSEAGAQLIARIEDGWPAPEVGDADWGTLAAEEPAVRHLLLARLAAEGQPPARWFHILPWDLVTRLAVDIAAALQGAQPGPVIRLRHWFAPAGSRFTAALEQLDEGIRRDDPVLARVGATALCSRLLLPDPAQIPGTTVVALSRLLTLLMSRDRFLGHTAGRARDRLLGKMDAPGGARHGTSLPMAAADPVPGGRSGAVEIQREPFTIRLEVTGGGWAEVAAHASLGPEDAALIGDRYGVMILPVRVSSADGEVRYQLILRQSQRELAGSFVFPVPRGDDIRVDVDGPPTGTADAARLDVAEVERSLGSLPGARYLRLWHRVGAGLPDAHPLREIIERTTI